MTTMTEIVTTSSLFLNNIVNCMKFAAFIIVPLLHSMAAYYISPACCCAPLLSRMIERQSGGYRAVSVPIAAGGHTD